MLRGLQWTTVIERTFAAESEADRHAWCQAIEHVAGMLQAVDDQDVVMADLQSQNNELTKRLHIGSKNTTSRGRKIVIASVAAV